MLLAIAIVMATFALLVQPTNAGAPLSGAIFTSLEYGDTVNHNLYDSKLDVYLNAGPGPNAPQTAAGLPDGNYYFQVTDPSGKTLLSQDPVCCREFRVEDGVIAEFVSKTNGCGYEVGKGKSTTWIPCWIDGKENGQHDLGLNPDHNSLTIQLMPYADTPNRGGVYKVWITPVEYYQAKSKPYHGFIPSYSKTDNFKVQEKKQVEIPTLKICKFEDINGDGVHDSNEPPIYQWEVTVEDPLGVKNTYWTDVNGCIEIYVPLDGTYIIEEELPTGWATSATIVNGNPVTPTTTVNLEVKARISKSYTVEFGNFRCFTVDGYKINDLDGDGIKDSGEPGYAGWKVTLYHSTDGGVTWTEEAFTHTDRNGYYSFVVCKGGMFKVVEEDRTDWTHTSAAYFTFVGVSGVDKGPYDFLNFQCFTVSGYKYEDMIGDGDYDAGDTGLSGWTISLYKKNSLGNWELVDETTTVDGYYSFSVCYGGMYMVMEETRSGWQATSPVSFEFTGISGQAQVFDFFNYKLGCISGHKWLDANQNGQIDNGEPYLSGFTIQIYEGMTLVGEMVTDANGYYQFCNLGPGSYEVKEVLPTHPNPEYSWGQTYPVGNWWFPNLESGSDITDADFGNVLEYTGGLTWGYWKTHSVYGPAAHRDAAYDLLDDNGNGMLIDLAMTPGDYLVDSEVEAYWVFQGCGQGNPNASGDGRSLFRAQLMALHMNLLKFSDMGTMYYIYAGDSYSGMTVQQIHDTAVTMLTDGQPHDFHALLNTIDRINNNGHYSPGNHVLFPSMP
jgi:hypothetical protein